MWAAPPSWIRETVAPDLSWYMHDPQLPDDAPKGSLTVEGELNK